MKKIILILTVIGFIYSIPLEKNGASESGSCALKACPNLDPKKINVHLIPHSHDDVGWLKTLEDYFYGLHNDIQHVGVEFVLDSVLQALQHNVNRRYIQVETAYFWQWWQNQTAQKRKLFKSLVDSGRIEMVGGGWSMNDEACVNYQSTINQFTWGLRLLNDTLGECGRPRIGWQIDPFGHSREQASIFKQMGYEAIFFTRLSEDDRQQRKSSKDLELMWKSNDNFENSEIFTSIMDSYYAPKDFCWEYLQCESDAINDDPDSFDYNLNEKVDEFSKKIANYSSYFKTNNILYTMGGDFQYQAAEINFLNIDKLIKGFKGHEYYNVFYSTPSCYVQAVNSANVNFSIKDTGDFFPYNENSTEYWAGYFTSRSTLKRYERMGNNILQAAQNLNAFAKMKNICNGSQCEENIRSLREAIGTMQHHDAITGTEKERVAYDYSRILTTAIRDTEKSIGNIIGNLLKLDNITENVTLPLSTCLLTNISVCDQTMKSRSLIVLYNPLPKYVAYHIRVPVKDGTYKLIGPFGDEEFDIVQHMDYPVKYPFETSKFELVSSQKIPPMGIKVFYLQQVNKTSTAIKPKTYKETHPIGNSTFQFTFNRESNKYTISKNKASEEIFQKFMYYNSSGSGAYVFKPKHGANEIKRDTKKETLYLKGKYTNEIIDRIGNYIIQTTRLFVEDDLEYLEFDWVVGPLNNSNFTLNEGKEIIVRYSTDKFTTKYFYTDSNGRQMIKRERNTNSSVHTVASNYYPVTSRIMINNDSTDNQLSILTDRSQGGGSVQERNVELMLHRRTLTDDHKGVEEPLEEKEYNEYIVTRGQHYLVVGSPKSSRTERILALNKLTQPWMLVADATSEDMTLEKLQQKINFKMLGCSGIQGNGLPINLNILNFEPWKDDTYLIRLEHIFEKNEDDELSKEVSIEMKYMFNPLAMSSIKELSLGANNWIKGTIAGDNFEVTLHPMEIRTFAVTFKRGN